jgi:hypothetical protein
MIQFWAIMASCHQERLNLNYCRFVLAMAEFQVLCLELSREMVALVLNYLATVARFGHARAERWPFVKLPHGEPRDEVQDYTSSVDGPEFQMAKHFPRKNLTVGMHTMERERVHLP